MESHLVLCHTHLRIQLSRIRNDADTLTQVAYDLVLIRYHLIERSYEYILYSLRSQIRGGASTSTTILMPTLINGSAVLVGRMPDLWSVGTSALTADELGRENVHTAVTAFAALPPFHFRLHCIENLRRDDRWVTVFHIILVY